MTTRPRLFISDPQMKDYLGHHFEYNQSAGEAAIAQGLEPIVWASKKFSLTDTGEVTYRPVFRFGQWDNQSNTWRLDLAKAIEDDKPTANDHIFLPTVYIQELEQLLAYIHYTPPSEMPHWHLFFRRDLDEYGLYERYAVSNFFRRLNAEPEFAKRTHFYVDTKEMAEHYNPYAALANKSFSILPIPLRPTLLGEPEKAGDNKDTFRIVYMGDARSEKGYAFLPQAVDYVLRNLPKGKKVEFLIQSGFHIPGGDKGMAQARAILKTLPHVSCPLGPFSSEEYHTILREADIALLPHDPRPFRRRSSGTLADALGAGKVTVVPEHCWLTTQIDETRAVTFGAYSQLGPAICKAIANFDKLEPNARAYGKPYQAHHSSETLIRLLIEGSKKTWEPVPVFDSARKKVLMVCDDWVIDPFHGSGQVGAGQLRYLQEQGYDVHVLMRLPQGAAQVAHINFFQRANAEEFCREFGVSRVWFSWFPAHLSNSWGPEGQALSAAASIERHHNLDLQADVWLREVNQVDPALVEACKTIRFDFVLLNYAHNMPLLDALDLKGAPIICETHDNLAKNKAQTRGDKEPDPREEKLELDMLSRCQGGIFISANEEKEFAAKLPATFVTQNLATVLKRPLDRAVATAGCYNLLDIAQAAGVMEPDRVRWITQQLQEQFDIDLLFVSSNHPHAQKSLGKFYKDVFVPYLKPRGIRLTTVGSVEIRWDDILPNETHVQSLGRMKELSPFYAVSKLVIIPIFFGTGTAIKTIEALGYGRPLVGTSLAFRGLGEDFLSEAAPLIADAPVALAEKILNALSDPLLRKTNAATVQKLAARLPKWPEYSQGFSELLQKVVPDFKAKPPAAEVEKPGSVLTAELESRAQHFNMMLRLVLLGGTPKSSDSQAILSSMEEPQTRALYKHIFNVFFIDRTSPFAKIMEPTPFFRETVRWTGYNFDDFVAHLQRSLQAAA